MPNTILASAFFDLTIYFPRDVYMLACWVLARDQTRADNAGTDPKTTVWDICDAVAYMTGVEASEIEAKFRDAGIDMEALVEPDPDDSPILERILQEEDGEWEEDDDEEFLGGDDDDDIEAELEDDGGSYPGEKGILMPTDGRRRRGKPPESMTFSLTAGERKLVLKYGRTDGAMLALLDQHTRDKHDIALECDVDSYKILLVQLTATAVKMKGAKYDELADLIGYLLQEAEDQGLSLTK